MNTQYTILTSQDIADILHINIKTARKMMHYKYFPRIKGVGNKLLVEKEAFEKYIRNEEYEIRGG